MDFEKIGRSRIFEWLPEEWGREHVAQIGTIGTFKPRSITHRFFKLTEGDHVVYRNVLDRIPDPLFGREPTLEEIVDGNKEKGYDPHPELKEKEYEEWYGFANYLEGMAAQQGVHAAGVVISDNPIHDTVPVRKSNDYDRITQYDMKEVENLGLIKYDFLVIANLDILKETCRLIKQAHGIDIDPWSVPDGDKGAYALFERGLLSGVFQFETSDTIKQASMKGCPKEIPDLAIISSLVRPGPAQAGFLDRYLDNDPDYSLPQAVRELWGATRGVLVYQEQLMELFKELCGYTLQEADDIRRIVGKKKPKEMAKVEPDFKKRFVEHGEFSAHEADYLWTVILGCADYLFCAAHAVAYSLVSYLCAYFKANYPVEFFAGLMSIRSSLMQPQSWAEKAPEYINEARAFDVKIHAPSVQKSHLGFTIVDNEIYFGLNGIRDLGKVAVRSILSARRNRPFEDVNDFIQRVNTQKVNTKAFEALAHAGAFDKMGYRRFDLLLNTRGLYDYKKDVLLYHEREREIIERDKENEAVLPIIERRNELRKIHARKRDRDLTDEELRFVEETKGLRKKPTLKLRKTPTLIEPKRLKQVPISIDELIKQADYIGCYLNRHPARILFPNSTALKNMCKGIRTRVAGQIVEKRVFNVRRTGKEMCILTIADGTAIAKIVIFSGVYARVASTLPEAGEIIQVQGKVSEEHPTPELHGYSFAQR